MAKKTKGKRTAVVSYGKRLAQDEYVQEQLRNATAGLREAYGRARRQSGRTAEDKKFYASLGEAASSVSKAANRLRRKPEPKKRGRKIAAAAVAGGAGLLLIRRRKAKSDVSRDSGGGPIGDSAAEPQRNSLTGSGGGSASS
jgi:hypothetical protein